jgi:hypothetical protein
MKYAVEMNLGALLYIQSFMYFGSGIQKLMDGGRGVIHSIVAS